MKKRIAVCGNGWSNEYIEIVLSGIRKCAKLNNADIFFLFNFSVSNTEEHVQEGHININRLLEFGNFDGVILLANTFHLQPEFDYLCETVQRLNIPSVSLEYPLPGIDFIGSDNYSGMHELCTHLVEHHQLKDFAFISGPRGNAESDERRKALEDVLHSHGLALSEDNVIYCNWNYYEVQEKLPQWINAHGSLPDIFVCANDVMAMAACFSLHELNYSVPVDVKVTGFDHLLSVRMYYPTIASVDRNWDNMGYQSLQYLLDKINGKAPIPEQRINSYAVLGESCGCNPADTLPVNRRLGTFSSYENYVRTSFWSGYLCDFTDYLSQASTQDELHTAFSDYLENDHSYEGDEIYVCLVDNYFSSLTGGVPLQKTGYTSSMHLICGIKNGKRMPQASYPTKELVPGYDSNDSESHMYTFMPLYSMEGCYGYLVLGNEVKMLYDYSSYNWMRSISQNLNRARRNIVITELNKQLHKLSVTDSLTGVYNRFGCEKIAYPYIEQCHSQGKDAVLMFADINKMKFINDKFGHLQGDTAICAVADAIRKTLDENWIIVRYGGDEFLMVGEYSKDLHPDMLSQKIAATLQATVEYMQLPYSLTVGIGHVIVDASESLNLSDCLKKADDAMYLMKKNQRKD